MSQVTVLIPTLRRREGLTRALGSVFAQDQALDLMAEVVVVDNSPEGSARATVEALRASSPVPLIYVHEPHPGVATARNAGLARSSAPYVAFLDDDEEAPPRWLAPLLETHLSLNADVTFGPVRGVVTGAKPSRRAYLEAFFSRFGPEHSGVIDDSYGCGNSVMTRATALPGSTPFDSAADQTGGEDDRLFTHLKAQGARFAWAAEASVYEYAPPHRATLSYAFRRAISYGQSPSQICSRADDTLGLARWMVIGAGQAVVYGAVALGLWMARSPKRYSYADRAARGVGKVFWTSFLRFYGAAEAERSAMSTGGGPVLAGRDSLTDTAANTTQTRSL
jgi:glycosyltransferase involved in cell wall biosynthesis